MLNGIVDVIEGRDLELIEPQQPGAAGSILGAPASRPTTIPA
jgi:hypothetical protein